MQGRVAVRPPSAELLQISKLDGDFANVPSLRGGGRDLMRQHSLLHGVFPVVKDGRMEVTYMASKSDGRTWADAKVKLSTSTMSVNPSPALDANDKGTYVAYLDESDGKYQGKVLFMPADQNAKPARSGPLTPALASLRNGYLNCSRPNGSVGYSWVDLGTGEIYAGISLDGDLFDAARVVHTDKMLTSGPSISVWGDYGVLAYETSNPEFLPKHAAQGNGFPVWMETLDAGKSWSKASSLLPAEIADYPHVPVRAPLGSMASSSFAYAAGGSSGESSSQVLLWPGNTGLVEDSRVFVISRMSLTQAGGNYTSWGNNGVGVLSFKLPRKGETWTHVVANDRITDRDQFASRAFVDQQYSALPKTPVRSVSYVDRSKAEGDALVFVFSVDTGLNFDHTVRIECGTLRFKDTSLDMSVSQCLYRDANGDVWIDAIVRPTAEPSDLYHVKVPSGISIPRATSH